MSTATPTPAPLGISVCAWSNNLMVHNQHFALSFETAKWYGGFDIDPVIILPHDGARNMGQAYNMARARCKYPLRIFMHQDVMLMDRSLGLKLRTLLAPGTGIGAVGPLGSTIDTGGGYWFCHPRFQVGSAPDMSGASLLMISDCRPLKVLDGIFLATNQDIEWSEEYDGTHMFIEDMCMRVRSRGLQVYSVDTFLRHAGGGGKGLSNEYWHSNYLFRRNWEHAFDNPCPPMGAFKAFFDTFRLENGVVPTKLILAGFYDVVWKQWAKREMDKARQERRAEKEAVYAGR